MSPALPQVSSASQDVPMPPDRFDSRHLHCPVPAFAQVRVTSRPPYRSPRVAAFVCLVSARERPRPGAGMLGHVSRRQDEPERSHGVMLCGDRARVTPT